MTRKLIIESNDQGAFFLLVEGKTVTIGSKQNPAETVLQNVRVRRIHCELEVEGDQVAVTRAQPGQGPSGPRKLQAGEVVKASNADLHLDGVPKEESSESIGLLPVEDGSPAAETAAASAAATEPATLKRLFVVDGADQGRSFLLSGAENIYIGKDRKNADIHLNDLYVGRLHCRIKLEGNKVTVIEEEGGKSAGGTLVNGKKVTSQELQLGDVLRVGNSHLKLELAEEDKPAEPQAASPDDSGAVIITGEEEPFVEVVGEGDEEDVVEVGEASDEEDSSVALPEGVAQQFRQVREEREELAQLAGQAFGHFRLSKLLGRGRTGVVFQALDVKDVKNPHMVALKVLVPQFPHTDQELQRFVKVIKGLLPLRHPNLVTLHTAGKTGSYTWIAREFIEGESVAEVLRRLGPNKQIDWRRACRVGIHVARALDFAHKQHLRHGKITPANLLLQKSNRATRITDLMLTDALEGSQLLKIVRVSRPLVELPYLAPEQTLDGAFVDELADLYNLGAVLYALLTGRPPFVGDSAQEVLEQIQDSSKPAKPRSLNYTIPPALEKVVLKALAKGVEDRYQNPTQLLVDLEEIAGQEEVEV
jgi:pSer/pThr/pTyr-binding forkhead associated (FHA) protein